ncbi:MAG: ROK family protein [Rhodospirillales bacterium]|nr:ROK family protein [Rhodospirillales bacterium]
MQSTTTGELLSLLRDRGPTSRAELARAIGVSAAALSKITADLIARGQVSEVGGANRSQLGRPPVNIALNGDCCYLVGAHVGAGRVELVVTDILLNVLSRDRFTFPVDETSVDSLIERVGHAVNRLIEASGQYRNKFRGVGIGVPGSVDRGGRLNINAAFTHWHDIPFADRIEAIVGLPAVIEHNVTAIALAEARFGVGREYDTVLAVYMRAGLGGGFAHSGRNMRGRKHWGPVEIGHIVLDPRGGACRCGGKGCVETVFSERPILERLGLDAVPEGGLMAAAMDQPAVWEPLYRPFLHALATAVTLIAPDLVVLGGHLGEAPQRLLDDLRRDLPPRLMRQLKGLKVDKVSLRPDAGAKGAACVGLERFVYEGTG